MVWILKRAIHRLASLPIKTVLETEEPDEASVTCKKDSKSTRTADYEETIIMSDIIVVVKSLIWYTHQSQYSFI